MTEFIQQPENNI